MDNSEVTRRSLLWLAPAAGVALALSDCAFGQEQGKELVEVTPTEDLMREHGLLKRILLIYDEVRSRIAAQKDFPPEAIVKFCKDHSRFHRAVPREA